MRIKLGEARLTVINLGDMSFRPKDVIKAPEKEWRRKYGSLFVKKLPFPSQSIHISSAGSSTLVDAGDFSRFAAAAPEYVSKGYKPPPGLVSQLRRIKVPPDAVGSVVITHAHYDHYAGVTQIKDGKDSPTFPKARHFLGRRDWEDANFRKSATDPASTEGKTMGVLHNLGLLELVSEEMRLSPGITVIPAPGESPGHQVVRVESSGEVAYCIGDMFHHYVEVENPAWMAPWCEKASNVRSRSALIERALDEDAIIIPAHMPPGRARRAAGRTTYVPIKPST